jgi:glycosyltransferase involved in cell wall biosynthesis
MDRVYYSLVQEYPKAVVSSQVIEYLQMLKEENNLTFNIIFLIRLGAYIKGFRELKRHKKEILETINAKVSFFPTARSYGKLSQFIGASILYFKFLKHRKREKIILHSRGVFVTRVAIKLKKYFNNIRIVYDIRGDYAAESNYHAEIQNIPAEKMEETALIDLKIQSEIVKNVNHIFCVSNVLKERVIEKYKANSERMDVIPCLADHHNFFFNSEIRERIRTELGVNEKFVFVYPGGIGYWHYTDKVFQILKNLMSKWNNLYFIILTSQTDEAKKYASENLQDGTYLIKQAGREEVPHYLMASDMGILLRENHPLNEVAAPTKFAEYIMTGLSVLISDGIGDYSNFVDDNNLGIVLRNESPAEEQIKKFSDYFSSSSKLSRDEISKIGFQNFAKINYAEKMSEIYSNL